MDDAGGKAWWRITPHYARSRAYFFVALLTALQVGAFLGAESVWWLELPVHLQTQYLVIALIALAALIYVRCREGRFTRVDRCAVAGALALTAYSMALLLGLTPALRALAPPAPQGPELARLR